MWDRAVVITLPDQEVRQTAIRSRLDFDFEFFYGYDGRNAEHSDLDYDADRRAASGHPHLTPPEIACAMSHRAIAMQARDRGERILVLEDDAKPEREIPPTEHPHSLAYLGYQAMNLTTPFIMKAKLALYYPFMRGRAETESIRRIYARPLDENWYRAGWHNGGFAYIIDPAAGEYICDLQKKIWMEPDYALQYLSRFSGLTAIAMRKPGFVHSWETGSVIGPRPSWK